VPVIDNTNHSAVERCSVLITCFYSMLAVCVIFV